MKQLLDKYNFLLTEFAVLERLRRSENVCLHTSLAHALFIYDETCRKEIEFIYDEYFELQKGSRVPFLIFTPTWRANRERLEAAKIKQDVNRDAVKFMQKVRDKHLHQAEAILIGGLTGCKNDCYDPNEALSVKESTRFHKWQIDKLDDAGVDFIFPAALPAVSEALGIAQIMSELTTPYILSFVINKTGRLLDGATLDEAFKTIDSSCKNPPIGFMVNCAHPSFLNVEKQTENVLSRLVGYQANASDKGHSELEGSAELQVCDISDWGMQMVVLNKKYKIKILGGCCGTNGDHLQYLVDNMGR